MPRQFAFLTCVAFVVWLFRTDMKWRRLESKALWVPGIWLAIIGSRPLGYWLGLDADPDTSNVSGNPINLVVQGGLMVASVVILQRRAFDWGLFLRGNKALLAIYLFFALSALWSFYPLPTLKRVLRDFGTVFMVLLILSDRDPFAAMRILFVRVSYLLFPFSVLFIKYYPEYGRMYSKSWEPMFTGVTTHKNSLGMIVMVFGLVLVLDILELRRNGDPASRKTALRLRYLLLAMGLWLLFVSDSKTSLVCAGLGGFVLWAGKHFVKLQSPARIVGTCVALVCALATAEWLFDFSGMAYGALNRNSDLTGRTEVWEMIKAQPINPAIGCGFMSFWDGPLGQAYHEASGTQLVSAHNGYLEAYVDGGFLGVLLLLLLLVLGGYKIIQDLAAGSPFGTIMFAFFSIAITYNWSESDFFRLGPLWFVLLLSIISCPALGHQSGASEHCSGWGGFSGEQELPNVDERLNPIAR